MNDLTKRTFDDIYITADYIKKLKQRGESKSSVVIDALTFLCHSVPFNVMRELLLKYLDPFDIPLKSGFYGFQRAVMTSIGHSVISFDPSERVLAIGRYYSSNSFHVTLTGHDCAFINSHGKMCDLIHDLVELGEKYPFRLSGFDDGSEFVNSGIEFKRIDLARDCFDSRFNGLLSLEFPSLQVNSLNNEFQWFRKIRGNAYAPGWTLYAGTRDKSGCFVRLYDKRVEQGLHRPEAREALGFELSDWVRLEFECKKKLPNQIVSRLFKSEFFYSELNDIYFDLAKKYFCVKEKTSKSRNALSVRPMAEYFADFLQKDKFCEELK